MIIYISLVVVLLSVLFLIRNAFVFSLKIRIGHDVRERLMSEIGTFKIEDTRDIFQTYINEYWSYDKMMFHFWIWDVDKMRNK